jgi:signal transduction histidine kinase/ActR/RegA family two-component response regulator
VKPSTYNTAKVNWIFIALLLTLVLSAGIYTRLTLQTVERTLPTMLLDQLQSLSRITRGVSDVTAFTALIQKDPDPESLSRLVSQIDEVFMDLIELRDTYVFDNLVHASAFHDAVAPSLVDARQWMTQGVSGLDPDSPATLNIIHVRLRSALDRAWDIRNDSHAVAQAILKEQRERLERFLVGVNFLMLLTGFIFLIVSVLIIRQQKLLRSESIAHFQRRQTEKILQQSKERAVRQRQAIAELALDSTVHSDDMNAALARLVETAGKTIHVSRAGIWRYGENNRFLECVAFFGVDTGQSTLGMRMETAKFPDYFSALDRENRIFAEDARTDTRTCEMAETYLIPMGITSILDAGIMVQGELIGTFSLEHIGEKRKWHSDEEAYASTLAGIAANVIIEDERRRLVVQLTQAQKMESVGRLAGGVAHDFNNMLGVILGHTELALLKAEEDNDLISDLKEIQNAAKRSANLTKQLLTFARKEIISPRKLDLNDTVESMLNMLRRLIGEDIDLVWKPAAHIWPVKMDPSQIDQILANLCINARDAISGVGKLTIETGRKTFDEEYCSEHPGFIPGDFVLLAVSDNGCGMDKDTLDNLFEPFFTTKEVGKGTGLGLATIYGIVKQNNGFINVYSEPGQGSTFKIYLPRLVADEDIDKAVPEKKAAAGGTETILLVEDEPTILTMTRMMLERKGYSVLPAATPGEAIDLAKTHADKIHLLMTDVVMPEMNGRDLAGQVIRLYPEIKRLFMSGYTADVIAHHGVLDDGVAFIQKPFSMADMTEKVREVLDMVSDKNQDKTTI